MFLYCKQQKTEQALAKLVSVQDRLVLAGNEAIGEYPYITRMCIKRHSLACTQSNLATRLVDIACKYTSMQGS